MRARRLQNSDNLMLFDPKTARAIAVLDMGDVHRSATRSRISAGCSAIGADSDDKAGNVMTRHEPPIDGWLTRREMLRSLRESNRPR